MTTRPERLPRPVRAPRPAPTLPYSAERIAELEAALVELRRRQEALPKSAIDGRLRLALLIAAFERTLERTRAAAGLV